MTSHVVLSHHVGFILKTGSANIKAIIHIICYSIDNFIVDGIHRAVGVGLISSLFFVLGGFWHIFFFFSFRINLGTIHLRIFVQLEMRIIFPIKRLYVIMSTIVRFSDTSHLNHTVALMYFINRHACSFRWDGRDRSIFDISSIKGIIIFQSFIISCWIFQIFGYWSGILIRKDLFFLYLLPWVNMITLFWT